MTVAMTATATVWEQEQLAECLRCGEATTVAPVAKGVVLAGGILCDDCRFHLIHIGEWGEFLARLTACPTRPAGDDDGDDDDPDGGPAAPAPAARRARGTLWLLVGGQAVARELSPDEEAELAEFVEACRTSTPDPEPCSACGRPASPYEETPTGPLCSRCWDPGPEDAGPRPRPGAGAGAGAEHRPRPDCLHRHQHRHRAAVLAATR